jgi:hypothetical protein
MEEKKNSSLNKNNTESIRQPLSINRSIENKQTNDRSKTKDSSHPSLQLLSSHFTVLGISYFEVLYQKVR